MVESVLGDSINSIPPPHIANKIIAALQFDNLHLSSFDMLLGIGIFTHVFCVLARTWCAGQLLTRHATAQSNKTIINFCARPTDQHECRVRVDRKIAIISLLVSSPSHGTADKLSQCANAINMAHGIGGNGHTKTQTNSNILECGKNYGILFLGISTNGCHHIIL